MWRCHHINQGHNTMTSSFIATTWLVAALVVTSSGAAGLDLTMEEGASGGLVVTAVVNRIRDRCIFPDDRLFLRRIAYVASRDGLDSATYSAGQNGGIWQINETQFAATKNCSSLLLSSACQILLTQLAINWSGSVTWSDLRKPLYSGLAGALYTLLQLNGSAVPGEITLQAQFWASDFGGNETEFAALAANATDFDCSGKLDLIFVLDSSGSVSNTNFVLMKEFAADVVQVMAVGADSVRVADVVYGSAVSVVFSLDDYVTGNDVSNALEATPKLGGGTRTNEAIDEAAVTLYDTGRGARSDARKVMILVTDGYSRYPSRTANSAYTVRERGTTVLAIGVGSYNLTELHAIASTPSCAHVFTLTRFTSVTAILSHLQTRACGASLVLTPGSEVREEIPVTPVEVVTQTLSPGPNSTIEAKVTCGDLDIYVSYTETNPSPVVYEEYYSATHGTPAVITIRDSSNAGSPIYITVVGARLSSSVAQRYGCSRYHWTISVQEPKHAVRLVNGGRATEGRVEVFADGSWGTVCDDNFDVNDAVVVCRMLGYEGLTPQVHGGGVYGAGRGTVALDEVGCGGAESSVLLCPHSGLRVHDCGHHEDVGLDCQPPGAAPLTLVRLVNGSRPSEGRLEVLNDGLWGTVCDNKFDVTDATVVCRMLNYTGRTPQVQGGGYYGEGGGYVWMDEVGCGGTETSLFLCPHSGLGQHHCRHHQGVGVDCQPDGVGRTDASSSQKTAMVAGVTAAVLLLLAAVAAVVCIKLLLVKSGRVRASKLQSHDDHSDDRSPGGQGSHTPDTLSPVTGLTADAPALRMPVDTRLPPLARTTPRLPPLRS